MKRIRIKYAIMMSLILSLVFTWGALSWLNQDRPTYNASSIVESIEEISELSLVQYNYTTVIGLKENKSLGKLEIPFTEKSFLATIDGQIKAGLNISAEILEEADMDNKKIKIRLPRAEIISHEVDESSLVVYDQSKNIINPFKIEDYNDAIAAEKKSMEAKAIESGILVQAEDRARELMRRTLEKVGYEEIEILIEDE